MSSDSPWTRVTAATLLVIVAVLLIAGVMTVQRGFLAQSARQSAVQALGDTWQLAAQIRFLTADLDGFQSAAALTIGRGPNAAENARGALLRAEQKLSAALQKMQGLKVRLEGKEPSSLNVIVADFEDFKRADAEVMRLYAAGEDRRATALLLNESRVLAGRMGAAAATLESNLGQRSAVALREQNDLNRDLLRQLIGFSSAVAACLVLMLVLLVVGYQQRSGLIQRLKWQVSTDGLTGVSNRRAWDSGYSLAMARAVRSGQTLSVVMLDLDHFKRFNDTYGHAAGDKLLRFTAQLLMRSTRVTDIVARYGGEEFALCLEGCNAEDAQALLERIKAQLPGGSTFSAGIAITNGNESTASVLERADKALYAAKRAGRNRVKIYSSAPATRDSNVTLVAQASATT
jgi:diguanylate cyclase (GGDEF)-like protein